MSIVSNHYPEVLQEMNEREEVEALAGAPESWSQAPSDEEVTAMGEAAGQLLTYGGDTIIDILPEDAPPSAARTPSTGKACAPRPKPQRSVRLLSRTHGMYELPDVATVEISITSTGPRIGTRTDTFRYTVTAIPADFGRGFQVTREDTGETYAVNLNGRQSSCECPGFLKWGHCKHRDALQSLVDLGRL